MPTPIRKSRRVVVPKKYTTDPFAGKESLLLASSDSGSDTSDPTGEEDEFDVQQASLVEAEEGAVDVDEAISIEESPVTSGDEQPGTGDDNVIDIIDVDSNVGIGTPRPAQASRREKEPEESEIYRLPAFDIDGVRALTNNTSARGRSNRRGIPDITNSLDKETRVIYAIGTGNEDLVAHIRCRDKWIGQATFPTRNMQRDNTGGLAYSYFHTKERRANEFGQGWNWYYEQGGRQAFKQEQTFNFLDAKDSHETLLRTLSSSDPFLIGPTREPTLIDAMRPFELTSTSNSWATDSKPSKKDAWIINAGARVQCLEWVPNQTGNTQYLTVVTAATDEVKLNEKETFNVYTPSEGYQRCLQIWEFAVQASSADQARRIDFSKKPTLQYVISFSWGYLKRLKWCPVPARDLENEDENTIRLGLLAGVWADGRVRVVDLQLALPQGSETTYIEISKASFESKPPDTVCTGVTWLSSSSIAASCANGFVAIWSIPSHLKAKRKPISRSSPDAQPWFYESFHLNYILSITSAYPSRPHLLITKGIDGYNRLTDLRTPNLDFVLSSRDRITQPPLLWHDVTQSALSTDDNFDIKLHGARLFYRSQTVARMDAVVTHLASSPVHPFVLVGCADGNVWSTNAMKRMRQYKKGDAQQVWFKHEWRRPIALTERPQPAEDATMQDALATEPAPNEDTTAGASHAPASNPAPRKRGRPRLSANTDQNKSRKPATATPNTSALLAKPLIRFTEGYRLTRPDFTNSKRANQTKEVAAFTTIYEEKTAVTQVSWNPNLHCGTWAAAGMASGLVRVEDLALD
jgi:transcription factor C subunit 6